jgi:hypothetical protein
MSVMTTFSPCVPRRGDRAARRASPKEAALHLSLRYARPYSAFCWLFLVSQNTFDRIEAIRGETHTHGVLPQVQHVSSVLLDVESDQRCYVITGHFGLLELYDAGRHELEASFDRLAWITGEKVPARPRRRSAKGCGGEARLTRRDGRIRKRRRRAGCGCGCGERARKVLMDTTRTQGKPC